MKLSSNVVSIKTGDRGSLIIFDSDTNYIHPEFTDDSSKFVESGDGQGTRYSFRYRTNNNVTYFGNTIYWGANYGFKWKQPLKKGTAIKMFMECECDATGGYSYHTVTLYAAKNLSWQSNSTSASWKAVNIISYASQSNYAEETPWTYMHKTLVEIPLDTIGDDDIFYIGFHKCDCGLSVTKIYFEGIPELV